MREPEAQRLELRVRAVLNANCARIVLIEQNTNDLRLYDDVQVRVRTVPQSWVQVPMRDVLPPPVGSDESVPALCAVVRVQVVQVPYLRVPELFHSGHEIALGDLLTERAVTDVDRAVVPVVFFFAGPMICLELMIHQRLPRFVKGNGRNE